jgi:hypothetical protein
MMPSSNQRNHCDCSRSSLAPPSLKPLIRQQGVYLGVYREAYGGVKAQAWRAVKHPP